MPKQGVSQLFSYSLLTTTSVLTFWVSLSKSGNHLLPQFPICEMFGDENTCPLPMGYRAQHTAMSALLKSRQNQLWFDTINIINVIK